MSLNIRCYKFARLKIMLSLQIQIRYANVSNFHTWNKKNSTSEFGNALR